MTKKPLFEQITAFKYNNKLYETQSELNKAIAIDELRSLCNDFYYHDMGQLELCRKLIDNVDKLSFIFSQISITKNDEDENLPAPTNPISPI